MASTTLEVLIQARDQFTATASRITGSLGKLEGAASRVGRAASTAIVGGFTLAAGAIAVNARAGIASLEALEEANAQTTAAIESTGAAAGLTATDIRRMSEAFEDMNALFDDKVVQAGANVLLTFTDIRKEAFEPAMQAALDLSVRMKDGLEASVLRVGKALNDPIEGLTALRKVGVQFTDQQEDQIKALVKSGDKLGAQRVILRELNKEFGGSFLAQGQTSRAKLAQFGEAVEELQMTLAEGLLPAIVDVAGALKVALSNPKVKADIAALGQALGSILTPANVEALVAAAGTIAGIVKSAVGLFTSLPPELQQLAIGALVANKVAGGLIGSLAGLALSGLKTITAAQVTVVGGTVTGGGIPGTGGGGKTTPTVSPTKSILDTIKDNLWIAGGFLAGLFASVKIGEGVQDLTGIPRVENGEWKWPEGAKLLRENGDSTDQLRYALNSQPPPVVNVAVNVTARDVDTAVRSSTSYGPTAASYYGGSTAPAFSH